MEVASTEEGFVDSYYEATVVAHLPKNGYVVQYATLVTDDLSAPLEEATSDAEVRPRPPLIGECEYQTYDIVDAFDNDGWWVGLITGRTAEDKYTVFFETTREEIAYDKDLLRFHHDWTNGRWIRGKVGSWLNSCRI